ncbi:hypothetical protein B0I37DRAFT_127114 [Chaetomium sp. MPI-CAGE-AT-0009]|nr:hypothetical protein B0I37DRAFT_127114 [Chaetomium sp. MPI-CAGE-AT-0009]
MPYSDNLYSTLDEEVDYEPIGETSTQDGYRGSSMTSRDAWLDTNTTATDTHADHHAGDGEDPHLFSPTDGYFGTATNTSTGTVVPVSSQVPHVPNVLVDDPSLQRSAAEGKAKEAEQERLGHGQGFSNPDDGYTSVYPSHTAATSRNGVSAGYTTTPTRQSTAPSSQSGATYYTPSSSTRIPRVASPSSYTTYSTPRSVNRGEHFPFPPREAPPAYTPSPTSPSNPQHFGNYQTFPQARDATVNMGRPEETQGLLGHHPESMRDHTSDGLDEEMPTWRGRMRRARRHVNWGCCKVLLIALVLFFVATGFLASVINGARGTTGRQPPTANKPELEHGQPNMNYPDVDGDIRWDPALFCKDAKIDRHKQTYSVDFGTNKDLILVERTDHDDNDRSWGHVHVQGAVILRRADADASASTVTVETVVTDERLRVYSSWDAEAGALELIVPPRVEWGRDRPRACVNFKITVWVPESSALRHLVANVEHLDIKLLDNLSLSVADGTKLSSIVGTITAASTGSAARDAKLVEETVVPPSSAFRFESRIIDVRTTSADIYGAWPLYDYLGLQSASGDIRVAIHPQEAEPGTTPKPAMLYIKTLSGDVDFREPIHAAEGTMRLGQGLSGAEERARAVARAEAYLPPREYRVDVHTTSGDIAGAAAFGAAAGFRSTSGTISLELLPVLDASQAAPGARPVELSTASTSGATDVRMLEPLWVDDLVSAQGQGGSVRRGYVGIEAAAAAATAGSDLQERGGGGKGNPLRCLHSMHTSTSAKIKLRYPASWEGDISLSTLTGALKVDGDGVKIIKVGSDWPGVNKMILARKGEKGEGGRVQGKSTSGDVDIWVGEK